MTYILSDSAASSRTRWTGWIGYTACAWALLFALEHVYWACGGSLFLNDADARDNRSLFVHDPRAYVFSWALLSSLFAILALFPLGLIWSKQRISRWHMPAIAILAGYLGLVLMATYSFATEDKQTGWACLGVCALGIPIALVRPRGLSVARWMALVATWIFGGGMVIYGCCYIVVALANVHAASFVAYLFAGGMNWLVEGLLFLATAWLMSRRGNNAE